MAKKKIPENAGVDALWIEALAKGGLEEPKEWTTRDVPAAGRPKSLIQGYLQSWYYELIDNIKEIQFLEDGSIINEPGEDMFADWYKDNNIKEYSQTYKLFGFFNTIAHGVHVKEESGWGTNEEFSTLLSRIAQKCIEELEYIEKIADIINEKYPGLATPFRTEPSVEQLNEYEQQQYQRKVQEIQERINSNIGDFDKQLKRIEAAKKTDIEKLAKQLNRIVIVGEAVWELVLYGLMSPNAPRMLVNNLDYRACIHVMLAGDISTAKSKVHKICKLIAPKMVIVDDMTKPSLEGVFKMGEGIQEGILDQAQNGSIIVEEFNPQFAKMPLFRRIMDCEYIETHKGGDRKSIDVNTQMLTACNPEADFFLEETSFRSQLKFKEGILTRFDCLIPLTATQVKNEILIDKLHLMTGELEDKIDFTEIKNGLDTLAEGMKLIKRVMMTKEQEKRLKDSFKLHNQIDIRRRILQNRPMVLLRDAEGLARFVNTIACVNFSNRKFDGPNKILWANDEDIDKAISLWENLLQFRVQLYGPRANRNLKTIGDEIVLFIHNMSNDSEDGWVDRLSIKHYIINDRALCGESTFYEEWNTLRDSGRIIQKGKRDAKAQVVIR